MGIRSSLSSWKFLLVAATFSRPRLRPLCQTLLRPFVRNGEISLRYYCFGRHLKVFLRVSDLESDFQGALELCARDTYHLDEGFHPDLVIDGGGNVGLFTLRVAAMESSAGNSPKLLVYEPLPRNIEQCRRHLAINQVKAQIVPSCLGGTRRSTPFYCREAIDSSFDPTKPYDSVIEIPVALLADAADSHPAERILIKLDIEGMEVEALSAFLPSEQRPVYVVGELHECSVNAPLMEQLFEDHGWSFDLGEVAGDQALFRACSPAALPLLASMAPAKARSIEMA